MRVDVWSDVACPWCFVGKRRLEAALSEFGGRSEVEVVWRSFELDPSAPAVREGPYPERLARKYGVGVDEARAMIDRMVGAGRRSGIELRFDRARPGNTFDAHRLLHLARSEGRQDALKERLLAATFTEGVAVGDRDALVGVAVAAGLDRARVEEVLAGDEFAEAVRADEAEAAALGVSGVPFFVVDGTYGIGGAQPPEVLLEVLDHAWDRRPGPTPSPAPGCDEDACAAPG